MSSERTEKATPKRREDAKKEGRIARSPELPGAFVFLGALFAVKATAGDVFGKVGFYIQSTAHHIAELKVMTPAAVHLLLIEGAQVLALLCLPVVAVGFCASVAGNFAQGGFTLNAAALKPKAEKFNPAQNIKRIFSPDALVNLLKTCLKLILISFVAYGVLEPVFATAPSFVNAPVGSVAAQLGEAIYNLAFRYGMVLVGLALADYGYALYKHEKSLRMTKQEIRDEYKDQEGDPMVKGQRRRMARALVQNRSIMQVSTASVVVTNPTHFAVALRYDREKDAAPVVVAKGADHLAAKIREIAKANDIPLVENPPLARALYRLVEPEQIIPSEFFGAVAEILAFVFRQKKIM
jgi:flagellar biosynthesis protein FlhB